MSGGTKGHESGLVLMTRPPGIEQGHSERLVIWMSRPVAARLRALGFEQPVELDALPGKWWALWADLAALGKVSEPGCGFALTVATTEEIAAHYWMYWREIEAGPFDSAEEGEAFAVLAQGRRPR